MTTDTLSTMDGQLLIDAIAPAMLQIVSVPPVQVKDTERVIAWSRRSTEKTPVPATERYRGTVVPTKMLKLPEAACSSKFQRLLQSTIYDLADAKFTEYVKERMHEIEMPASLLSLDNVLAFWAEEKQRNLIDADKIVAWLKDSKTLAALPAAKRGIWLSKVPKIAAPGYKMQWTKPDAASLIAKLQDDELEHPVAVFIATRCNNILAAESQEAGL